MRGVRGLAALAATAGPNKVVVDYNHERITVSANWAVASGAVKLTGNVRFA